MALLDELLIAIGLDSADLERDADRAADGVERGLGGIASGAAGIAVGAAFVAGLQSGMDITSVTTRLEHQLGLTEAEAERVGGVVGDVYAAGFGTSMEDVGQAVAGVASNLEDLAAVSDDELTGMAKAAAGLAEVFEFDVAEATQAAGTLMKSGLAADGTEAFDLLTAAAQELPLAMQGELPTVVTEYSEFFSQLGATGPQMMGALAAAADDPLFQIDKLADSVKEFTLAMAEGGAGAADALDSLDLSLADLQELIDAGEGTKAFDQVVDALADVEDQTERTRLQAELMGGPGEDVGNSLLAIAEAGGLAGPAMQDVAGASADLTAGLEDDPAHQLDSALRQLETTLGTALLPVIEAASDFFAENQDLLRFLAPIVLAVAAAMTALTVAQWAYNAALAASGIGAIIIAVGLLVTGIIYLATQTTFFQDMWSASMNLIGAAWDWVWGLIETGIDWITDAFLNWTAPGLLIKHWDDIAAAVDGAWDWITGTVGAGVDWVTDKVDAISELPDKVAGWFGDIDLAGPLRNGFRSGINWIIDRWNNLSFSLPSVKIPGLGTVGGGTIHTPNVPRLAAGGVVEASPGGTLAVIGEAGEDEAVIPLDRLDTMMRSVAGNVARSARDGGQHVTVTLNLEGGEDSFKEWIRNMVRTDGLDDLATT